MVMLVVAAAALVAGAAVALTSGDARGLLVLSLGGVGGWAACQGLTRRAIGAEPASMSQTVIPAEAPAPSPTAPAVREGEAAGWAAERAGAIGTEPARSGRVDTVAPDPGGAPAPAPAPSAATASLSVAPAARAPLPAAVLTPELVAVGAARESAAAVAHGDVAPEARAEVPPEPERGEPSADVPAGSPPAEAPSPAAEASAEVATPLPTEVRLQDLAERQRSSTADLRRSIRDVIERLEDDEPAPRRRGKKSRR